MFELPSPSDIFEVLSSVKRALHPRELASRLEISPDDYSKLIAALDELERDGQLKVLPGGRIRAIARRGKSKSSEPKRSETSWQGSLTVHPKGFGFVTGTGDNDVFIPPDAIYEALHGDVVRVRVTGKSRKGLDGVIESVVKRRSPRVPGVIRKKGKSAWLDPDDMRLRGPIVLADGARKARDGDAAVVNITRFPDFAGELPEGEVEEILGPQGDPQTEVKKILIRDAVVEEHSADALKNAEQMAARLGGYRLGTRRDLRHIPLPTIDPDDARDHDDALWVERTKSGYRAYIAIADVSEYVRPESALDEEARNRGCTIYLPDRAIPMLPRALAGDLCSLLPEQDRFCMCVIAEIDKKGVATKFEIVEGLMRSCAKLTYGGVARTLGFDPESPQSPAADAMKDDLLVLQELTEKLRKNRMKRGALDLDLPEARVVLDEGTGSPIEVKKRATRPGLKKAYSLVEEMMLLANELVAEWLVKKDAPGIYRIHGTPNEEKLERLAKVTQTLKVRANVEDLVKPQGASKFLAQIKNHERKGVLEMLLLRSLQQAVYDTNNVGHFGLASERYVHFTSPIRRYPDLRVHRQIKFILRGGRIDRSDQAKDDLALAATESSKKERAAMEVEREVLNLYRAIYMRAHLGEEFEGRVTGISGGGIYLTIEDPCVDVMIQYEALGPDQYETDEDELGVIGKRSGERIMLGDTVPLRIDDISIVRRTVYAQRLLSDEQKEEFFGDEEFEGSASLSRRPRKTFRRASGPPRADVFRPGERPGRRPRSSEAPGRDSDRGPGSGRRAQRSTKSFKEDSAPSRGKSTSKERKPGKRTASGKGAAKSSKRGTRAGSRSTTSRSTSKKSTRATKGGERRR